MTKNSELVKNTFLISLAQISAQIINFLLLPLYTSVLSTEEYGRVDLYGTLRSVSVVVLFLGMEQSLFRFCVSEENTKQRQDYFSIGIILAICCYIVFSACYVVGNCFYKFQYAKLLYTYLFIYGIFNLLLYIARGFEKTGIYVAVTTLGTLLTAAGNIVLVLCFRCGVKGILLSSTLAYTVLSMYMLLRLPILSSFHFRWEWEKCKEMLAYSVPLVLNNVMGWIATSSDRLIIVAILGNSMNGIYSLANKFYNIFNVVTNGFIMAWAETAIKVVEQQDHTKYYRKMIVMSMDVFFLLISGMITVLPIYFKYFINEAYGSAYYHIPIILYGGFWYVSSAITGHILLAHKRAGEVGIGTLFVGVVNLALHLSLIGRIGLYAASISTLVSYLGLFVFRYIFMYRYERIPFQWMQAFVQFCTYFVLCLCYYRKGNLSLLIEVCIYLIYVVFFLKKYRIELVNLWRESWGKIKRMKVNK